MTSHFSGGGGGGGIGGRESIADLVSYIENMLIFSDEWGEISGGKLSRHICERPLKILLKQFIEVNLMQYENFGTHLAAYPISHLN